MSEGERNQDVTSVGHRTRARPFETRVDVVSSRERGWRVGLSVATKYPVDDHTVNASCGDLTPSTCWSAAFVSLGERIDCTTPAGKLQPHILAVLAGLERPHPRNRSGQVWHGREQKVSSLADPDAESNQNGSPESLGCPSARLPSGSASLGPPAVMTGTKTRRTERLILAENEGV